MKRTVAPPPHLRGPGALVVLASLVVIGLTTLLPEPGVAIGSHFCLLCGPVGGVSAILNVLLFVPFGIGLAVCGVPWRRAVLTAITLSVAIETAQFLGIPGRYSTIGDVITNSLGGALGFAIGRYAFALLRPSHRAALGLLAGWSAAWLAIAATSAYSFAPSLPSSEYYVEIAQRLGDFEQFRGRVIGARIGNLALPDSDFEDDGEVRDLLLHGVPIAATVIPAGPTAGLSPILRVVESGHNEIALLAQNGGDLVFGVRTGAAVLRLRPPFVVLPGIVPSTRGDPRAAQRTIEIEASYSARIAWFHERLGKSADRRIPLTGSLGWTLLTPSQWFIEGTPIEGLISAIWIGCLLLPLGYWGLDMVAPAHVGDVRMRIAAVLAVLLLIYLGLVSLPQAFGAGFAPARDWLASVGGLLLGGFLRLASLPTSERRMKHQFTTETSARHN